MGGSLKAWVRDKTCGWGSKRVGGGSKKVGEGSKSVGEGQIVWVGLETSSGGSKRVGDRRNAWLGLKTSGWGVKKGWVGAKDTRNAHTIARTCVLGPVGAGKVAGPWLVVKNKIK